MRRSPWFRKNLGVPKTLAAFLAKIGIGPGTAYTQTYSTAAATVAANTAPAAAGGSGADATTFAGAECDAVVADHLALKKVVNQLIDDLQAAGMAT